MNLFLDSMWRAGAYCLHWRVIVFSLLPLLLLSGIVFGAAWFLWEPAIDAVYDTLSASQMINAANEWLAGMGLRDLKAVLAPLIVLLLGTPLVVILTLLAVAVLTTPAMVRLVAARRFPVLEKRHGGSFAYSLLGTLGATAVALLALVASMPLWLVPPLVLVLPPLIWGWLTYRVMSYDVLAEHASKEERRELIRRHKPYLFAMGVITGYLGAAPTLVMASSVAVVVAAPVLIPLAIWIYTLVFAFSSLWFAHHALSALQALRAEPVPAPPALAGDEPTTLPPSLPILPPL